MASEQKYTAADIEVLTGLKPLRKRPAMYIGDTGSSGLHYVISLAIEPDFAEAEAGLATLVQVTLCAGGAVTVEHTGCAAPLAPDRWGVPEIEAIMTQLHGGPGNLGLSVLNGFSSRLDLTVWDNGAEYAMAFENGERVAALRAVGNAPGRRGTRITFTPAPEVFSCDISYETVLRKLRELALQRTGTRFVLVDLRQEPARRAEL